MRKLMLEALTWRYYRIRTAHELSLHRLWTDSAAHRRSTIMRGSASTCSRLTPSIPGSAGGGAGAVSIDRGSAAQTTTSSSIFMFAIRQRLGDSGELRSRKSRRAQPGWLPARHPAHRRDSRRHRSRPGYGRHAFHLSPQREWAYEEEKFYRGLHPMMGKRLHLWRLSNFKHRRLPSVEDVYLLHAVARDNPKDERLFACAEVRDVTPVRDEDGPHRATAASGAYVHGSAGRHPAVPVAAADPSSGSIGTAYSSTSGRRSILGRMNSTSICAQTGACNRRPGIGTGGGARPHSPSGDRRTARHGGAHFEPGRQRDAHHLPTRGQAPTPQTADRIRPESRPHAPARAHLPLRNHQDAHARSGDARGPNFPPAILSSTTSTRRAICSPSIVPTVKTRPTSSLASSATLPPSIPRA